MPNPLRARLSLATAGLLAVAACSTGSTHSGSPGPHPASTPPAKAWTRTDLHPVSQPVVLDDRVILFTVAKSQLQVVGLDASTGRTIWTSPASASAVTPGEPLSLIVAGSNVVFLTAAQGPLARLTAVKAATGEVVWKKRQGFFTDWPAVCADDPMNICLTGGLSEATLGSALRFESATGAEIPSGKPLGQNARAIGPGLVDPGDRHPERLIATSWDGVAWDRPLRSIFTFPGASSNNSWNFDLIDSLGIYVGSVGGPPVSAHTFDMSRTGSAGFGVDDGAVVWRDKGSVYVCHQLPCPGARQNGNEIAAPRTDEPTLGLRLRLHGRVTASANGKPVAAPDATAVIEGFDLSTGRTQWSFDAGHDTGLVEFSSTPPQTGLATLLVRSKQGSQVNLDLTSGHTSPASASTPAWCRVTIDYQLLVQFDLRAKPQKQRYVGQLGVQPCTGDGKTRPIPAAVPDFVGEMGARAGGLIVWADSRSVSAAPVEP